MGATGLASDTPSFRETANSLRGPGKFARRRTKQYRAAAERFSLKRASRVPHHAGDKGSSAPAGLRSQMVAIEASCGRRATLFFLGGAAIPVHQAEDETLKANRAVGDAVGRFLEMPLAFRLRYRKLSCRAISGPMQRRATALPVQPEPVRPVSGLAHHDVTPGTRDAADVNNREATICWDGAVRALPEQARRVDWRKSNAFYLGLEPFNHPVWLCERGYRASRTPAARYCSS